MVEQTEQTHKHFGGKLPEETRQHLRAAREEFQKSIEGMLPPGFKEHRRNARKEMLMAWRSIIDASLQRMEEPKKKA
ncbi:MAG: hypothetical protein ABSF99_06655 [Anaerolineales bacterium]|jgi:ribosomal protein L13